MLPFGQHPAPSGRGALVTTNYEKIVLAFGREREYSMSMKRNEKPRVGRSDYAQDQKRQVFDDKRTKRQRTRADQKRRAIQESE